MAWVCLRMPPPSPLRERGFAIDADCTVSCYPKPLLPLPPEREGAGVGFHEPQTASGHCYKLSPACLFPPFILLRSVRHIHSRLHTCQRTQRWAKPLQTPATLTCSSACGAPACRRAGSGLPKLVDTIGGWQTIRTTIGRVLRCLLVFLISFCG
jgi:hypothetical protein